MLARVDGAAPSFCWNCGLPQLTVSPGAIADPETTQEAAPQRSAAEDIDWRAALRVVGLASLVGAAPVILTPGSLVSGNSSGLVLLLTPVLSMVCVSVYYRSRPRRKISGSIGARIAAVLGLLMGCWVAFGTGVAGFVLRYGYRSTAMDEKITQVTQQLPLQMAGTSGPVAPEILHMLTMPEFRAGYFLAGHSLTILILVAVASLCGRIAGALLHARRMRHVA